MDTAIGTLKIYLLFTLPADIPQVRGKKVLVHSIHSVTHAEATEYAAAFRAANDPICCQVHMVWTETPRIEYL